jgi:CrcB protein
MNMTAGIAVFSGAGLGALLRWALGHSLNPLFPSLPPGTLAANVLGGLLMGLALGAFSQYEAIPPALRLAMTTGFLGGLTTFSTFSAESVTLLLRGEYRWMLLHILLHVVASLLATLAGMALVRGLLKALGGPS